MTFLDYADQPSACPAGPHRGPEGPNEDLSQCSRCLMPSWSKRPATEQFGLHLDNCSLPIDHESCCKPGGEGHSPEGILVRGFWRNMDADIEAAIKRKGN